MLGATLSFPIAKPYFVQILHVYRNHWITVEGISDSLVTVYDSMYTSTDLNTRIQIAALMRSSAPAIDIIIAKSQFQTGTTDYGVYSIAFANGNNPASYRYKQDF